MRYMRHSSNTVTEALRVFHKCSNTVIKIFIIRKIIKLATSPGADPGFPVGEGADPLGGGVNI